MRRLAAALLLLLAVAPLQAAQLRITGVEGELLANIEAYIGPPEETGRMSYRALARHAEQQARLALEALGYYQPSISTLRRGEDDDPVCVLRIRPGKPVQIGVVDIVLEDDRDPRELREFIAREQPQSGDVFHHGRYEGFKNRLLQQALMLGYFRAAWTQQQARVDRAALRADITLAISLGPRYRVGETTVSGEGLDPGLIGRFPRYRAGDWYDAGRLAELHRDLVRTGWFDSVRIRAEPDDAQDLVIPVTIDYTPRLRNRVGIGAGFSTDVGPRAQLQWEKPWLNRHGHSLSSYLELSEVRTQFEASYLIPLADPVTSQLALTYGVQVEDLNDHDYWLTTVGVEHRKRLPSAWRLVRAVEVQRETDDFGDREFSTTLLIPGITLSRTDAEGAPLVHHGWRSSAKLQFADTLLLSDTDLVRAELDAKGIYSLGERVRVIARAGAGALETDDILDVPVSLRFFAGGDQSIRGYQYESIAPEDVNGDTIGGLYRAEASLEFDWRFAERWLVAAFADRGSAFNNSATADFVTGAGAGIRWLSPIGPLRLDFAWGVSEDDPPFNIHFYMGPEL